MGGKYEGGRMKDEKATAHVLSVNSKIPHYRYLYTPIDYTDRISKQHFFLLHCFIPFGRGSSHHEIAIGLLSGCFIFYLFYGIRKS